MFSLLVLFAWCNLSFLNLWYNVFYYFGEIFLYNLNSQFMFFRPLKMFPLTSDVFFFFCIIVYFFLFMFSIGNFYWYIFGLTDSFPGNVESNDEVSDTFFISPALFILLYFLFPIIGYISLMKFPICLCMLFIFSSRNLNILITVILNYLLGSFNILWLISESGSINCFVFLRFLFLALLYVFQFLCDCSTFVRTL